MASRARRGFTLMQMLIVVAIIAILVAIAIPTFNSSLERAREAACLANITACRRAVTIEAMMNDGLNELSATQLIRESVGEVDSLCPSAGTYSVSLDAAGALVVSCSEHGKDATAVVGENTDQLMRAAVSGYFKVRSGESLDSSGPNFGLGIRTAIAEALEIEEDFDFKIVRISTNEYQLYLFDRAGEDAKSGDMVEAALYTLDANGEQTGAVEYVTAPLQVKYTDDRSGKTVKHFVLKP